ncbi:MAG: hypothetical protein AAF907_11475 [Planctomycetota bacterium]
MRILTVPGFARRRLAALAGRRSVSAVTLVAMLVCQAPLPLATPANGDGGTGPAAYPCQDRRCGCGSAEACWAGCCCFTNAQKVAWAKENGVEIPAFVHAAAKRETAAAQVAKKESPKTPTCCSIAGVCGETGISEKKNSPEERPADDSQADGSDAQPPLGWITQRCRGEQAACGALPWALAPVIFVRDATAFGRWERVTRSPCEASGIEPPTPPPRRG